jgi:hypothetical protein
VGRVLERRIRNLPRQGVEGAYLAVYEGAEHGVFTESLDALANAISRIGYAEKIVLQPRPEFWIARKAELAREADGGCDIGFIGDPDDRRRATLVELVPDAARLVVRRVVRKNDVAADATGEGGEVD